MNEKETIIIWNEAVELYKSNPADRSVTEQAVEKFQTLIAANPQQSVSKLCYNAAALHRCLNNRSAALKVNHK